jgi:hypothetical protein
MAHIRSSADIGVRTSESRPTTAEKRPIKTCKAQEPGTLDHRCLPPEGLLARRFSA